MQHSVNITSTHEKMLFVCKLWTSCLHHCHCHHQVSMTDQRFISPLYWYQPFNRAVLNLVLAPVWEKVQRRVGPYRVLTLQMLCVFEGSRLDTPWHCPVERCHFTTDVRRSRASHLLRSHHLLFEGNRRAPRPLVGQELAERLEAFRLRNRGSRQRARENQRAARAAASVGGGLTESASAETPMADPPASPDEDWGDAAIDWDGMLEEGFFSAEAYQLLEGPGGEEQETTSEEPQASRRV